MHNITSSYGALAVWRNNWSLWAMVALLLPAEPAKPTAGRPRINKSKALTGILFEVNTGIPWEMLSQVLGYGSGMT